MSTRTEKEHIDDIWAQVLAYLGYNNLKGEYLLNSGLQIIVQPSLDELAAHCQASFGPEVVSKAMQYHINGGIDEDGYTYLGDRVVLLKYLNMPIIMLYNDGYTLYWNPSINVPEISAKMLAILKDTNVQTPINFVTCAAVIVSIESFVNAFNALPDIIRAQYIINFTEDRYARIIWYFAIKWFDRTPELLNYISNITPEAIIRKNSLIESLFEACLNLARGPTKNKGKFDNILKHSYHLRHLQYEGFSVEKWQTLPSTGLEQLTSKCDLFDRDQLKRALICGAAILFKDRNNLPTNKILFEKGPIVRGAYYHTDGLNIDVNDKRSVDQYNETCGHSDARLKKPFADMQGVATDERIRICIIQKGNRYVYADENHKTGEYTIVSTLSMPNALHLNKFGVLNSARLIFANELIRYHAQWRLLRDLAIYIEELEMGTHKYNDIFVKALLECDNEFKDEYTDYLRQSVATEHRMMPTTNVNSLWPVFALPNTYTCKR